MTKIKLNKYFEKTNVLYILPAWGGKLVLVVVHDDRNNEWST